MGTNAFLTQAALELATKPPNVGTNARVTQVCIEMIIGPVVVPPPPPLPPLRGGTRGGGVVITRCCTQPYLKHVHERISEYDLGTPLNGRNVFKTAQLAAPADALVHIIGTYPVPLGFWFQLQYLVLNYFGGGWVPGDWNVIFSLDVNTGGNPNAQGIPVQYYNPILTPLGSFQKPWPVVPTEFSRLAPRDILRAKVQTNPVTISPGFPNRFAVAFVGHLEPVN